MTNTETQEALKRRFDNFVDDEVEAALIKVNEVRSEFTLAGAFNGSRRFIEENKALIEHFQMASARMAWMIYQVGENGPPKVSLLKQQTTEMAERIFERMAEAVSRWALRQRD